MFLAGGFQFASFCGEDLLAYPPSRLASSGLAGTRSDRHHPDYTQLRTDRRTRSVLVASLQTKPTADSIDCGHGSGMRITSPRSSQVKPAPALFAAMIPASIESGPLLTVILSLSSGAIYQPPSCQRAMTSTVSSVRRGFHTGLSRTRSPSQKASAVAPRRTTVIEWISHPRGGSGLSVFSRAHPPTLRPRRVFGELGLR
jgi:hypothetical protein